MLWALVPFLTFSAVCMIWASTYLVVVRVNAGLVTGH